MPTGSDVVNVVIAGLGGQGVIKASDILAEVAFRAGHDVKKSELHGMSQRGGSVSSDVRFGNKVWSPMVPFGCADYLVVLSSDQLEVNRHVLKKNGVTLPAELVDASRLGSPRCINVALLGALSTHLEFTEDLWNAAIRSGFPEKLHEMNIMAFQLGRMSTKTAQ